MPLNLGSEGPGELLSHLLNQIDPLPICASAAASRGQRGSLQLTTVGPGRYPMEEIPVYAAVVFRGRPPLRPFLRDAARFASVRAAPPVAPIAAIHLRVPNTPSIKPGT